MDLLTEGPLAYYTLFKRHTYITYIHIDTHKINKGSSYTTHTPAKNRQHDLMLIFGGII